MVPQECLGQAACKECPAQSFRCGLWSQRLGGEAIDLELREVVGEGGGGVVFGDMRVMAGGCVDER